MNILQIDEDRMYPYGHLTPIPQGQVGFSQLEFRFSPHWDIVDSKGLIAQFIQGDQVINQAIVDQKCSIPSELKVGSFLLFVRGYSSNQVIIATANGVSLEVVPGAKDGGTPPVPPDPDLYQSILEAFNNKVPEGGSEGQVLTKTPEGNQWKTPSGGGGGEPVGSGSYNDLSDLPSINSVTLRGNVTTQQLGIKDGRDGKDGKDGYTPIKGVDYFDGAPGRDGQNGAPGARGEPGKDGADGKPGPAGADGKPGPQGEPGKDGAAGRDGQQGPKGDPGKDATFGMLEIMDGGSITHELQPNTLYVFKTTVTDLGVTLQAAEGFALYDFIFLTSGSGCNLSIPVEVHWDGDKAPELKPNMKYEVSILDNVAMINQGVTI